MENHSARHSVHFVGMRRSDVDWLSAGRIMAKRGDHMDAKSSLMGFLEFARAKGASAGDIDAAHSAVGWTTEPERLDARLRVTVLQAAAARSDEPSASIGLATRLLDRVAAGVPPAPAELESARWQISGALCHYAAAGIFAASQLAAAAEAAIHAERGLADVCRPAAWMWADDDIIGDGGSEEEEEAFRVGACAVVAVVLGEMSAALISNNPGWVYVGAPLPH